MIILLKACPPLALCCLVWSRVNPDTAPISTIVSVIALIASIVVIAMDSRDILCFTGEDYLKKYIQGKIISIIV